MGTAARPLFCYRKRDPDRLSFQTALPVLRGASELDGLLSFLGSLFSILLILKFPSSRLRTPMTAPPTQDATRFFQSLRANINANWFSAGQDKGGVTDTCQTTDYFIPSAQSTRPEGESSLFGFIFHSAEKTNGRVICEGRTCSLRLPTLMTWPCARRRQ